MKNSFFLFVLFAFAASCKNDDSGNSIDNANPSQFAYTIKHPFQWEWGNKNNIKMALDGLKAYEKGNVSAAFKDYADTVLLQMDGFEKRMSKDSLLSFFLRERSAIKRMGIEMNDYLTVRSKDGKSEYVSLWYKQLWEDQNGKIDSIECMDDLSFKNGKIILWNEKVRRYPGSAQ
ncbi:hypothetical protein [Segetibacter sp.]|jgi:hypothetical protein|uniref:hypothetical protein n=1 Tax=Segetibacter sp. TaxID=2231182 RepID=UPI002636E20E|nr:hypothetical protein [Segetibacter sp.]MCW3082494.1 hypothetical protein [Segetibacter sp.]